MAEVKKMLGKAALLEAIAGKNRGILATEVDQQSILATIAQLEDRNPIPHPVEAVDKLNGNWRLLYTTSQELLQIDRFPFLKLGQIYQYIQASTAKIYNIAEVSGVPYLEGIVSVVAGFEPLSDRRVKVNFWITTPYRLSFPQFLYSATRDGQKIYSDRLQHHQSGAKGLARHHLSRR